MQSSYTTVNLLVNGFLGGNGQELPPQNLSFKTSQYIFKWHLPFLSTLHMFPGEYQIAAKHGNLGHERQSLLHFIRKLWLFKDFQRMENSAGFWLNYCTLLPALYLNDNLVIMVIGYNWMLHIHGGHQNGQRCWRPSYTPHPKSTCKKFYFLMPWT